MAEIIRESKYAKKLAYRKANIGMIDYKDKQTEFQQSYTAVPLPLNPAFVGPKRGPGKGQQQVYSPLPHEKFQVVMKFNSKKP